MLQFYRNYFIATLALLLIEIFIGAHVHDTIIRPFGGDFLVVILLYCLVKTFVNAPPLPTARLVLLFAYCVEISQYFHLVNLLGLRQSKWAIILLGTTFSITDLLAYTLGIVLVIIAEHLKKQFISI